MLQNTKDVTVTFGNTGKVSERIINATRKLIAKVLEQHGFTGIWRVALRHQVRTKCKDFDVNRIGELGKDRGVKITTMPGGRDTAWESILIPPTDYDLDDVFSTLKGKPVGKPVVLTPKNEDTSTPIRDSSKSLLEIGAVYWGKVASVQSYGAFVELHEGITGMVNVGEWDHSYIADLRKIAKVGKKVKVAIIEFKDDEKTGRKRISLSRQAALEYPDEQVLILKNEFNVFKGVVDDGTLILKGFGKDQDNLLWLLTILARNYNDIVSLGGYIPNPEITKVWTTAFRERFECKRLSSQVGPFLKSLERKDLLIKYTSVDAITDRETSLGYDITDIGWGEIGGREKFRVDKDQVAVAESDDEPKAATSTLHAGPPSYHMLRAYKQAEEDRNRLEAAQQNYSTTITELEKQKTLINDMLSFCRQWLNNLPATVAAAKERAAALRKEAEELEKLYNGE